MDILSGLTLAGIIIESVYFGWKFGKVEGKVDGLAKQINNNGFTCKQHSQITQQLGELQGEIKKSWDGNERRKGEK